VAVSDIRERWRTSPIEATTDWAVEHEHVADALVRLMWGTARRTEAEGDRAPELAGRLLVGGSARGPSVDAASRGANPFHR
jgi:hypothetical protein